MTSNNLDRMIAEEEFEYGEHIIRIKVRVKYGNLVACFSNQITEYDGSRYDRVDGKYYYRVVEARAIHDDEVEVKDISTAALTADERYYVPWWGVLAGVLLRADASEYRRKKNRIIPLDTQIEATTRPVLEEVDELYGVLDKDYEIDVEVGVERVSHEISWVEVEDEIDRISKEVGLMTGGD